MTASPAGRSPTCLACLRRLAQPFGGRSSSSSTVPLVQTRAKSNRYQPRDQGVVVRLLQDIPKFGRKDAIFRAERGRMRNEWYPRKMAEYMTAARFRELGLPRTAIGERDATFGTLDAADLRDAAAAAAAASTQPTAPAAAPKPLSATPEQAHTFLTTLISSTLVFYRKPIPAAQPAPAPAPEPPQRNVNVSPLVAGSTTTAPTETETETEKPATSDKEPVAIFGSVSAADIVSFIKTLLVKNVDASRIVLEPEQIRFVGGQVEDGTDRVKTLGRFEIDIVLGNNLEPIRKIVEVLPVSMMDKDAEKLQ